MSRIFRSAAECPVDRATKEWIDDRMNWLIGEFGIDWLHAVEVILPNAEFFPDEYKATEQGARVMLDRVCDYMELDAATIDLHFYQDRNPVFDGEFRQGTAGLYEAVQGRHHVWVETGSIADPLALVATLAHELAHVYLLGQRRVSTETEDHEPLTDLLTVFLGMGVFTANAVIRETYWNEGAVSGWSMGRQGYLTMPMYGYALALFARARGEPQPPWAAHLRADVEVAFKAACRFLAEGGKVHAAPEAPTPVPGNESINESSGLEENPICEITDKLTAKMLVDRYKRGDRRFKKVDLRGICLRATDLRGCDFTGADLTGADFAGADLRDTIFLDAECEGATLTRANLRGSKLKGAVFSGADLSNADLTGADIRETDFADAIMIQAILRGTIRDQSTDLSGVDLSKLVCDEDLTKENLTGWLITEARTSANDRFIWFLGLAFLLPIAISLGGCGGAALGGIAGTILHVDSKDPLFAVGAIVGIIGSALATIRKYMKSWGKVKD